MASPSLFASFLQPSPYPSMVYIGYTCSISTRSISLSKDRVADHRCSFGPQIDLELYNVRTDAWGLATIALLLLIFTNAVPNPLLPSSSSSLSSSSTTTADDAQSQRVIQSYAKMAIAADVFHHVMTGLGAWKHYSLATHYNTSMAVGVWGCAGLAGLGLVTLLAPAGVSGLGLGAGSGTGPGLSATRDREVQVGHDKVS